MLRLFRGGARPQDRKEYLQDYVHGVIEPAGDLVYPLPGGTEPLVAPGDPVLAGQKLAQGADVIHCACSGTVKTIERRPSAEGERICIVVENDRRFTPAEGVGAAADWQELSRAEILRRIADSGTAGMDARRFPTAAKLTDMKPGEVSRLAVDATDWEPIVTSDTDLIRTRGHGMAEGLRILLRLFPGAEGVILMNEGDEKTIAWMAEILARSGGIRIVPVAAGASPGDEGAITARLTRLGEKGRCVVMSPGAVYGIYEAVVKSTPVIRRIVTVAGSAVKNPGNYLVRVGTTCAELLSAAGVKAGQSVKKAVLGGSLTGTAIPSLDVPVSKDTGALLLFAQDEAAEAAALATECIRCGRCARVCPVGLLPMLMARAAESCDIKRYENELHGVRCTMCGRCAEVCPAKRPLTDLFRYAGNLAGKK